MKPSTWMVHTLARAALKLQSPLRMKRAMVLAGRFFGSIDLTQAVAELDELERAKKGTCLSRAMSVAVRLPGAEIVIGISKDGNGLSAHAWIEVEGVPIRTEPVTTSAIGRL